MKANSLADGLCLRTCQRMLRLVSPWTLIRISKNSAKRSCRKSTRLKFWEIIADDLSKAGWSLGWVSAVDLEGRTIWIVDAHGYGKRFVVHAMKS